MVESLGTLLASGTRSALRYARERVRNQTPAALSAAVTGVAAVGTSGAGSGYSDFTRASGSWLTDGIIKGQIVQTAGFSNATNNGNWRVHDVTSTTLTVRDAGDIVVAETAATGQTLRVVLLPLRATGRNVNLEKNALESQEVDPDGQETEVRHGFNRVVGSPGFQLSLFDYDDMLEAVMSREWDLGSTIVSTGVNLAVNTAGQIIRASGTWAALGFRPGDIVSTSGFTNPANNRTNVRVTAVSGNALTLADPDDVMVVESSGGSKSVTYPGRRLDIGTDMMTYVFERAFADIAQYQRFNGVAADQFSLTIEPESIINGTLNLLGMSAAAVAGSSVSGVSALTARGSSPFAAFEGEIYENGAEIAVATSLQFTLARNRSLNPVIGSKFSPDVFAGTARINGTLAAYFDTAALLNRFINETESSMWMRMDDPNYIGTRFISIVFPRVKYNGGTIDPPQEGPVTMEMPFRALKATGLALPGGLTRNSMMTIQVSNGFDD